jgi:hypothetical protein
VKLRVIKRSIQLFAAAAIPLFAANVTDISLTDGRVLKGARIVSIGEKQVAILHSGGMTGVPPELVPLDVLARAHMALAASASERKEKEDTLRLKATKRIEDAKARHDDEIKIRLAEANARETAGKTDPAQLRPDADAMLSSLKARFPAKRSETVMVHVKERRSGIREAIEIEVPSSDLWSNYQRMVQTTTVQALPVTLRRMEERIKSDYIDLEKKGALADEASRVQASKSAAWLTGDLLPFIGELRAVGAR